MLTTWQEITILGILVVFTAFNMWLNAKETK
jgi:hypothetical protein